MGVENLDKIFKPKSIAIIAEITEKGKRRMIGVTRLILKPGSTDEGEFALVVSDE